MSKYADKVAATIAREGLEAVSVGLCPGCETCARDFGLEVEEFNAQYEAGEFADEGGFSFQACALCGSTLGGDRYAGHGIDAGGALVHFEVCTDCLFYLANGEEPAVE